MARNDVPTVWLNLDYEATMIESVYELMQFLEYVIPPREAQLDFMSKFLAVMVWCSENISERLSQETQIKLGRDSAIDSDLGNPPDFDVATWPDPNA